MLRMLLFYNSIQNTYLHNTIIMTVCLIVPQVDYTGRIFQTKVALYNPFSTPLTQCKLRVKVEGLKEPIIRQKR